MEFQEFRQHQQRAGVERAHRRQWTMRGLWQRHPAWHGQTPSGRIHHHDGVGRLMVRSQHLQVLATQGMKRVIDPYQVATGAQGIVSGFAFILTCTSSFPVERSAKRETNGFPAESISSSP